MLVKKARNFLRKFSVKKAAKNESKVEKSVAAALTRMDYGSSETHFVGHFFQLKKLSLFAVTNLFAALVSDGRDGVSAGVFEAPRIG